MNGLAPRPPQGRCVETEIKRTGPEPRGSWRKLARVAFGGLLLGGCAHLQSTPPEAHVNLTGYSASFRQGYADGCDSAGAFGQRRQERRYKSDADYRIGWDDGFNACSRDR